MPHLLRQLDESIYSGDDYYCADSQCQYIYKLSDRYFLGEALVIGSAGCDGILFGFLLDDESIYAYYPIEDKWVKLCSGFNEFIAGWISGPICV
jgi:hypothetical protein